MVLYVSQKAGGCWFSQPARSRSKTNLQKIAGGRRARANWSGRPIFPADRGRGFGAFDHGGSAGDAGALAKAFKQTAISDCGTVGPEFVRRIISEDVAGEDVRGMVADFMAMTVPAQPREAWNAAAWALARWIDGRGGTEPAEVRQAIEQVRLFIEQHGESRFEPFDDRCAAGQ
jgi:putative DNA primase/helicase